MLLLLNIMLIFFFREIHDQGEHLLVLQNNSTGAMEVKVHCVDENDQHVTLEYFLSVAGEDCHLLEGINKITSISAIHTDADHQSDSVVLKRSAIEDPEFYDENCGGKIERIFEYKYGRSVRSSMSIRALLIKN